MNRPFAFGDKVLLLDNKQRRYLINLAEGAEFHSHTGFFAHADLVGRLEGVVVKSTKGRRTPRCARRSRTSSSRCRVARR
jgi:tRNA A58 N-methylase Trm61